MLPSLVFVVAFTIICYSCVIMSALLGYATTVIPHWLTHYVASGLFAVFGLKMLKEGQCTSQKVYFITVPVCSLYAHLIVF